ncbi:lymphocyte antigen 6C2 [Aethina tumida]|uniref:lymphocyte antigen 6C2 n=1 Tax=Aethina tumida TaxID=116153 RepID=UPI00096B3C95|nr:lymphocyte antigen 6C2 [Aethina tumida]
MSKLPIIFICLTIIYTASALQCYHCVDKECENPMKEWKTPACTNNPKSSCLKHVYKDANNKVWTTRKCIIIDPKMKPCNDKLGQELSCTTCSEDLCNSASKTYGQYALVVSILALFVSKIFFQ